MIASLLARHPVFICMLAHQHAYVVGESRRSPKIEDQSTANVEAVLYNCDMQLMRHGTFKCCSRHHSFLMSTAFLQEMSILR